MRKSKTEEVTASHVARLAVAQVQFAIIGRTPLLMNRQSQKAIHQFLLPAPKKNKAERAAEAKHDPVAEFRSAAYLNRLGDTPTACHLPGGAFKGAMKSAALRIPGGNKTETGQLVNVSSPTVYLYGVPYLHAAMVRQAGMTKTPDIRFRPIFPEWCCLLDVTYVPPLMNDEIVFNLLTGAGLVSGVGDGRPEKGALSFGQFSPTDQKDPKFISIMKNGGRAAQLEALQAAEPYDDEARDLLEWFTEEAERRRFKFVAAGSPLELSA